MDGMAIPSRNRHIESEDIQGGGGDRGSSVAISIVEVSKSYSIGVEGVFSLAFRHSERREHNCHV